MSLPVRFLFQHAGDLFSAQRSQAAEPGHPRR
jgi:hypothetical protein